MSRLAQLVVLCLLPASALAASVVGSGIAATQTRPAAGFHGVALGIPANVEIRQGGTEGVTLTGDDNVLPLIETRVTNGTLEIRWRDRGTEVRAGKIAIVVQAKSVDALTVGGAGSMRATSLATPALTATLGGSGAITIEKLDTDALKATIGGSGTLSAGGRADRLDGTLAGSGRLSAPSLQARDAQLALQGSPEATVRVRDTLTVTIAGSGSVTYYGKPRVTQTIMGSGSLRGAGE
jgi:hypothetical protein